MKIKIIIVVLAVAAIGLGIGVLTIKQQAEKQHESDTSSILDFSNQVVTADQHIETLRQDNLALTNSLNASVQQAGQLSNSLAATKATVTTLEETRTKLTAQVSSLDSHVNELNANITGLNTRISELELQNKALDERANELTNAIAQLNIIINETRSQLAVAKNNGAFLQSELQKQMAQKAELEHKFNDVDDLRVQLNKIKTELFIARRAALMKNDTGLKKGAELLQQHTVTVSSPGKPAPAAPQTVPAPAKPAAPAAAPKRATTYDLNVEVGSDGSVRAIPPLGTPTNSAAH